MKSSLTAPQRLSNLDLNGRLVKRGVLVSWHGLRCDVVKVNRGRCFIRPVCRFAVPSDDLLVRCESVQVVQ